MKIIPVGDKLLLTDERTGGRADRLDEDNGLFSVANTPKNSYLCWQDVLMKLYEYSPVCYVRLVEEQTDAGQYE
jgi:hypothetical protein